MKFEKEYYVEIKDIGLKNKMTNYAFLSKLEEIASDHSNTVGYGAKDIEEKKKAWLLMDWKQSKIKDKNLGKANRKATFFHIS